MEDRLEDLQLESMDQVGSITFSPPPMKKSDTRDSISSIDSDISLSNANRRGSKGEEADLSDNSSDTGELISQSSKIKNKNDKIDEEDSAVTEIDDDLANKICGQVEFYFSDENIVKDAFLLKHVKRNKEGYVSLKLISSFKKVKHLSRDWRVVGAALRAKSTKLQVNELGTKLRRLNPLPKYDETLPSRTILAVKLPLEKLTIESVAELFRQCGEIALIRILRPGHPIPAEIRQALTKKPDIKCDEECALIEFTNSAAARAALILNLPNAKIHQLHKISMSEKKRKQSAQQNYQNHHHYQQQQQPQQQMMRKGSFVRQHSDEDNRISKLKMSRIYQNRKELDPPASHSFHGLPSSDVWLSRRFSACTMSDSESNSLFLRRLSACSNACSSSGSISDNPNYLNRRFSSCSSSSDSNYNPSSMFANSFHQNVDSSYNYWPGQSPNSRRYSCCSPSSTTTNYPLDYSNGNNSYYPTRRGSLEYGQFLRKLSNCSRDSGYEPGSRRMSSCSSGSAESFSGFRSRSNSGFVLMAHLPENVTRMPSGPDGTRGFGRKNSSSSSTSNIIPIESSCG